jgi:hypothetical protein
VNEAEIKESAALIIIAGLQGDHDVARYLIEHLPDDQVPEVFGSTVMSIGYALQQLLAPGVLALMIDQTRDLARQAATEGNPS